MVRIGLARFRRSRLLAGGTALGADTGRARQLSGQHRAHLRELPHAERAAGKRSPARISPAVCHWDEPPFKVTAPNITPDKETGIGNYTDAQLKTVLRKGIKPNGVPVAMVMPSGFYEIMTERDLNAVVAYLQHAQAGQQQGAGPDLQDAARPSDSARRRQALHRGDAERQSEERASTSSPSRIAWSATRRSVPRGRDFANKLGAGGAEFHGPVGHVGFAQHHVEQDQRSRRLDRCRDQAGDHAGRQQGRQPSSSRRWAIRITPR